MPDHENLALIVLKSFDYEMLSEVRHVHTFDRIDAREPACRLGQQIDNSAAAFDIARRRFDFNQRLNKSLYLGLPRLQSSKNLTCKWPTHLIVSLRTVSASMRFTLTLKPMPGASGALIVPRSLTSTGGSMMSSSQYRA